MAVQTKASILSLIAENQGKLAKFGVRRCGLFGSFSRDEHQDESDIDILVDFVPEKKTFDNFMRLCMFLEELFDRKVDIVTTESLSPYIGPHILREVVYAPLSP